MLSYAFDAAEIKRKPSHVFTVYLVNNTIIPSASTIPKISHSMMSEPAVCIYSYFLFLYANCTLHTFPLSLPLCRSKHVIKYFVLECPQSSSGDQR